MKLTEEQIECMFRVHYADDTGEYSPMQSLDDWGYQYTAFKAAISLLLPIIEKLQESNEFYTSLEVWDDANDNVMELYSEGCHRYLGELARNTKQEVKQMIEKLGDV